MAPENSCAGCQLWAELTPQPHVFNTIPGYSYPWGLFPSLQSW